MGMQPAHERKRIAESREEVSRVSGRSRQELIVAATASARPGRQPASGLAGRLPGTTGRLLLLLAALALLLVPRLAVADLFEDSLDALTNDNLNQAALSRLGQTWKGGLASMYPQVNLPANPLLNDFTINGPCGSFSAGAGVLGNLMGMMDPERLGNAFIRQVQDAAMVLIHAGIQQLPMLTLCYASPTICDIVKQVQDVLNEILHGKLLTCSQAEGMLASVGMKFSGQRQASCISRQQAQGMLLAEAEQTCASGGGGLFDAATGAPASQTNLIAGSLARSDAPHDIRTFASQMLGEVRLNDSGGGVEVDIEAPTHRLHDLYQDEAGLMYGRLAQAARLVAQGTPLPAQTHRRLSLPGMAMPYSVLRALDRIRESDPAAYRDYTGKLAASLALLKMTWRVNETRDQLEEGMQSNARLSDAEREVMRGKLGRLEIELARLVREKEMAERHAIPVMQAIVEDDQRRREMAGSLALGAGADMALPDNRFGGQNDLGYGY